MLSLQSVEVRVTSNYVIVQLWPLPGGVTAIEACTPCASMKTRKKGIFFKCRRDTRVLRLGYQKREKSEKRVSNLQHSYAKRVCKSRGRKEK